MLSRALKIYEKVQSISTNNLTGFWITTGNRRARIKLSSPVPNITDVNGHVVRCKYDGVARLCRKCRLPGQERKKCATQQCTRCEQWGHPTCDARTLQALWWGSPSTPLQAKAVLGGNHVVQCAAKVEPSTAVSAEVQGAPAPKTSDKGKQGETIQAGPGEAWYKIADRKSQDRLRPLSPLRKSRFSAPTHLCKHRNPSNCKKSRKGLTPPLLRWQRNPLPPLPSLARRRLPPQLSRGEGSHLILASAAAAEHGG